MQYKESETVELKQELTDELKKEIIAFANSLGGVIYIGVSDDGEVVGVADSQDVLLRVTNMIRDAIKPDITVFTSCKVHCIEGKDIVVVSIQRGTSRPYYLHKKGLKPEGVYVRQGASSVPATDTAIRFMIKETDGDKYEDLRSLNQELDFTSVRREFANRNMILEEPQMSTLGFVKAGEYTNLALLLSAHCAHTTKIAVFQDDTSLIFRSRKECRGCLLDQLRDAFDYIGLYNKIRSEIDGLYRVDVHDYPAIAIREALVNAIVHRDYSSGDSTFINIFSDRIEIVSAGGLLIDIQLADIMQGYSSCRNPMLANLFYRLELIEAYGTGIQKILAAYKGKSVQPKFKITPGVFRVVLPNVNVEAEEEYERTKRSEPGQTLNKF